MSSGYPSAQHAPPQIYYEEAACALSEILSSASIPHAFCGGYWAAILSGIRHRVAKDIDCIVQAGMGTCVELLQASGRFVRKPGVIGDVVRLYIPAVYYGMHSWNGSTTVDDLRRRITTVKIDLLKAGEVGPANLSNSNTFRTSQNNLPFLTPTEFIRAKAKAWQSRRRTKDADDIYYAMRTYQHGLNWERLDSCDGLRELAEADDRLLLIS